MRNEWQIELLKLIFGTINRHNKAFIMYPLKL